MPNIQVTCPACKAVLEIDAVHAGQEIECGSCLQVFVAKAKKSPSDSAGRSGSGMRSRNEDAPGDSERSRSSRGSRRRDEDDDEDDYDRRPARRRRDEDDEDDYEPLNTRTGNNGPAITSLVLGIISVLLVVIMLPIACVAGCCCAPLAWLPLPVTIPVSLGAIITGAFGLRKPDHKALAITGIVLGALTLTIAVLQLAFGFLPFLAVPPPPPRVR